MATAEAALAIADIERAASNFERAGLMRHDADAELGLVRTTMQAGDYARALAFAAHTAGAHRGEPEGAALYAWLLHIGGQRDVARRLLQETVAGNPTSGVVKSVNARLQLPIALATGELLQAPTRFAPYAIPSSTPWPPSQSVQVAGSGVLVDDGRRVLVPVTTLLRSKDIWVRNGLGQISRARVERQFMAEGMAVLRLAQPLPIAHDAAVATRDAFPGSIVYCVEYAPTSNAEPAWPTLMSGFLGPALEGGSGRQLGIDLPKGPRGGAVFDGEGRLIGISRSTIDGPDTLVPVSTLRKQAPALFGKARPVRPDGRIAVDQIYESSMRSTLQILVTR